MKKILILICIVTLSVVEGSVCFSQETSKQFIHKGILRAMGTISPGSLVKEQGNTISIHGSLEYYVADNISIRGDSYYFLKGDFSENYDLLDMNHEIVAGASYHFRTKNHFDPYFAFEPGIAVTQISEFSTFDSKYYPRNTNANPLISFGIGFNYYFQRWFHLFAETRYISGKYLANDYGSLSLNELKFSFGLGFNLNVIRPKN